MLATSPGRMTKGAFATMMKISASLGILLGLIAILSCGAPNVIAQEPTPNIVFVMADDLDTYTYTRAMPKTQSLIADEGVTFDNAYFAEPLCCPSRASMFRGQYPHNTHVTLNTYPDGSFRRFWEQGLQRDTYATHLQASGYKTFYAGKVMNGYGGTGPDGAKIQPALPGFDTFRGAVGDPEDNTFKFGDGSVRSFPDSPVYTERKICKAKHHRHRRGHRRHKACHQVKLLSSTTYGLHDKIVTDWAENFVEGSKGEEQPFALVLSLHSPHLPASYPDSYQDWFQNATLPPSPSYDEADISDKPSFMQPELLSEEDKKLLISYNKKRLRSAAFADNQVGQLVAKLKETGQFHNTLFVFWSDNGYHMGQHRQIGKGDGADEAGDVGSKGLPYTEDVKVPMIVKGPGIPAGARMEEMVSAVDLLPTFMDVANAPVPEYADGRSFLGVAQGSSASASEEWRDFAYSEVISQTGDPERNWQAVYTDDFAYHDWTTANEEELYNVNEDPHQLDNLLSPASEPPASEAVAAESLASSGSPESESEVQALEQVAANMSQCQGEGCRDAETK